MPLDANIYTEITSLDAALDTLFKTLDAARESSGQDRLPQAMTRPTAQAEGSVLCAPVVAALPFPPFALAAASGYALKAADTYAATGEAPATLQQGKTCFAISSGDALPPSCDAIALSAHAAVDGKDGVSITAPMLPWLHVRRIGSDIAAGEALFCRNHILRPSDIGALLAAGVDEVQVWDRLEVFLATVGGNFRPAAGAADGAAPATGAAAGPATGTGTDAADGTPGAASGTASAPTPGTASSTATDAAGSATDTRLVDGITPSLVARIQALDCRARLAARLAAPLAAMAEALRDFFQKSLAAGGHALLLCVADEAALAVVRTFLEADGQIVSPNVGLLPGAPAMTAVYEGRPVFCLPSSPAGSLSAFSALVSPTLLLMSRRPAGHCPGTLSGGMTETGGLMAELASSLPAYPGLDVFSPLALARVGEKTVALPLRLGEGYKTTVRTQGFAHITANGKGAPLGSSIRAHPLRPVETLYSTLFCAGGSDLILDLMADALLRQPHPVHMISVGADAADALEALKNNHCHAAVLHMADDDKGEFNFGFVQRHWPQGKVIFVNLAIRQVGLVVPAGNPRGLKSIADIRDKKLRCVNRLAGSSTRLQFDALLRHAGLTPQDVSGYETEVESQLAVAAAVLTGKADCGPGVAAAANAVGLDFVPLGGERWDLVIPRAFLDDPRVISVQTLLQQAAFKKRIAALGGYETTLTGQKLELGVRLGA
ncbi:substrate-binding domain-containing protein [Desulfovibrio sp. 86]|uniref:MoeA domain protein domain I and II n=1 Tax=uncultured Desulfovibrio sp. TaxID=167968 RepID=A0A212L3C9_9BACT|nr:substrate-binding domain-containing protein [Desulfovibrio sp. 86]SCM72035.1 MoeA domain protein domain I and II [uncultured Desulfovibrio sp.]VZH33259.1 MoeA domain protein domain I and II [Desulfovibrio sp. 86]